MRIILLILLVCFAGIQFIRPTIAHPPVTGNIIVPADVEQILRNSCYNCHSNETKLAWFDQVAPAYWMVASHIGQARMALNFSEWDKLSPADQKAKLYLAINKIIQQEMPLPSYAFLHRGAVLTQDQIDVLKNYLVQQSPQLPSDSAWVKAAELQFNQWIDVTAKAGATIKRTPNDIAFIPDYRGWTAISTTDRFDNNTLRVILGNDIAVKAIKENHIRPWPDGTMFAKIAWTKLIDTTGQVRSGEFKQVEFMIKDSEKYASTNGWGWARWKGMDLAPYGNDVHFTTECTNCHQPMKANDFIFTVPVHMDAITSDSLTFNPFEEKLITSGMNIQAHTMSILYGNKVAAQHAFTKGNGIYPAGAVLYQVTWKQQPDAHWFGGNIPSDIQSVEVVQMQDSGNGVIPIYAFYAGTPLRKQNMVTDPSKRIAAIVMQRAAVTP